MTQSELVVVETFANRIEAELAQGVLEGAGIDSLISADDAGGQYANVWLTGIRLLVRSEDARQAKEVLREPAPGL